MIIVNSYEEGLPVYGIKDVISCLESLIVLLALDDKHLRQLKVCLRSTVKLCQSHSSHCTVFVDAIGSTLINSSAENDQNEKQTVILCEALGAIGSLGENVLLPLLPDILIKLKQTSHINTKVNDFFIIYVKICPFCPEKINFLVNDLVKDLYKILL